jgi:hypothetical protein
MNDAGHFVTIYGQEFSTISTGNHMNVFDIPDVITVPNGAFDQLATWANGMHDSTGQAPLMQMNHPNNPATATMDFGHDDFGSSQAAWVAAMDPLVELIEVLSGPALAPHPEARATRPKPTSYLQYLDLGFHVAPSSGQDNHYPIWGSSTETRTGVIADHLTRRDILDALHSRHAYATQDRNLSVIFRVNGALQGDILHAPAAGSSLTLTVSISDQDEPAAHYSVQVLTDQPGDGIVARHVPGPATAIVGNTASPVSLPPVPFAARGQYVLLIVTQANLTGDADRVWTAPVWLE